MSESNLDDELTPEPEPTPEPTLREDRLLFVRRMILRLREALLSRDPMIASISVDGDSTSVNRKQALDELRTYEDEERALMGENDTVRNIAIF